MKIFVSWSKEPSKKIAEELKHFIEMTLPGTSVWMSEVDIGKGKRWGREIAEQLEATNLGVVCCTENNLLEPWLHFEAGALSKSVSEGMVFPVCFGFGFEQLPSTLAQFQATKFERTEILKLVHDINAQASSPVDALSLEAKFKRAWSGFEAAVNEELGRVPLQVAAPAPQVDEEPELSEDEEAVIKLLVSSRARLTDNEISRYLQIHQIKVDVVLDSLRKKKLLDRSLSMMGGPQPHYLSSAGKKLAVKKGWVA